VESVLDDDADDVGSLFGEGWDIVSQLDELGFVEYTIVWVKVPGVAGMDQCVYVTPLDQDGLPTGAPISVEDAVPTHNIRAYMGEVQR